MSDTQTAIQSLATRFFDAIEMGDIATVRGCYADDAVIWHNTDGLEQSPEDNAATLRGMVERIPTRRYDNRSLRVFDGGFLQQHVLVGIRKDGVAVRLPACIICTIQDGRITRLDEYFDSAHVTAFRKVIA